MIHLWLLLGTVDMVVSVNESWRSGVCCHDTLCRRGRVPVDGMLGWWSGGPVRLNNVQNLATFSGESDRNCLKLAVQYGLRWHSRRGISLSDHTCLVRIERDRIGCIHCGHLWHNHRETVVRRHGNCSRLHGANGKRCCG